MAPDVTLGFLGAGKLAGSVIRGLLRSGRYRPEQIVASEPNEAARATLREETQIVVSTENTEVAERADVILLGVKPGVVLPVIEDAQGAIAGKLVISLAAGIRLAQMEATCATARFLRAMTNTPSAICRGATALAPGTRSTEDDLALARDIFGAVGAIAVVTDEQIDAVTALAGSGPAFVYTVIEAFAEGAKREGLEAEVALQLATQTVLGAAQLASESDLSPDELRKMVITPGGTTAAGLAAMEKAQSMDGLIAAIQAATARGRELMSGK